MTEIPAEANGGSAEEGGARAARSSPRDPRRHRDRLALRIAVLAVLVTALVWFWDPLLAQYRRARARTALDSRRDVVALQWLRDALYRDPDDSQTLVWLARTHRRLGNLERATWLLQQAESLGGDARRIELERRLILAQSGRLRDVEPLLADMLIDAGADGPDVCEAFVQGFFLNLRTAEAADLLDVWQETLPQDPQPHFLRAYLFKGVDRNAEAEQHYRLGLAMDPDQTTMRRRLAEILIDTNQLEQAESELARCQRESPDDPQIYYALARSAFQRGAHDAAVRQLEETLRRAPDHVEARRLRGQIRLADGQPADALPDLEAAAAQRPYDTLTREALGRTLLALNRPQEAQAHLDYVREATQQLDRVNRLLREAVERPDDAEVRFQIGSILFQYGAPDDAARWTRAALELQPDHAGAHRALAAYSESRGDAAAASYHRQRVPMSPPSP
ncbi:MAG: tetratricopeptide repeat protein [Pirellulaceae bacterium]|nr:tetratricopeptide repeat protein [Pirellulaceae bacterium]